MDLQKLSAFGINSKKQTLSKQVYHSLTIKLHSFREKLQTIMEIIYFFRAEVYISCTFLSIAGWSRREKARRWSYLLFWTILLQSVFTSFPLSQSRCWKHTYRKVRVFYLIIPHLPLNIKSIPYYIHVPHEGGKRKKYP